VGKVATKRKLGLGRLDHIGRICKSLPLVMSISLRQLFQAVALFHVAATFWAVHYGYGLPLAGMDAPHKEHIEKVRVNDCPPDSQTD
jgi:hypothetical protein